MTVDGDTLRTAAIALREAAAPTARDLAVADWLDNAAYDAEMPDPGDLRMRLDQNIRRALDVATTVGNEV